MNVDTSNKNRCQGLSILQTLLLVGVLGLVLSIVASRWL